MTVGDAEHLTGRSSPPASLPDALRMASQGIRLFPIGIWYSTAERKWEKAPRTPHGHRDASSDPDQIRRWAEEFPGCSWGMLNDIFATADADGLAAVQKLNDVGFPNGSCPRIRTMRSNGLHIPVKNYLGAGCFKGSDPGRWPGVDSRGGGTGWTVLYEPFDICDLVEAPSAFREIYSDAFCPREGAKATPRRRHDTIRAMIAAAIRKGKKWPQIRAEALAYRDAHAAESARVITNAEIDSLGEWFGANVELPGVEPTRALAPPSTRPTTEEHPERELFTEVVVHRGQPNERTELVPIPAAFVETLMGAFSIATMLDNEEVFVYRDGYFERDETRLKAWVEARFEEHGLKASNSFVAETIGSVRRRTYVPRSEFGNPRYLCLLNGTYDLDARKLVDHSPEHRLLNRLPVIFDPTATCPGFDRFLVRTIPDEGMRGLVQEFFGYVLLGHARFQVAFIIIGPKRSGKSTIVRVLVGLVGTDNVSHLSLKDITDSRFGPAHLYGKKLNAFADLPRKATYDLGVVKSLIGQDAIEPDRKNQGRLKFTWDGKILFSANDFPEVPDDDAFFDRWKIIQAPETVPPEERVEDYHLTLLKEAAGIFNWAVTGLNRLLERGRFDTTVGEEVRRLWVESNDHMVKYVRTNVVKETDKEKGRLTSEQLLKDYGEFCDAEGVTPVPINKFPDAFRRRAPFASKGKVPNPSDPKKDVRGWRGVRLRRLEERESQPPLERFGPDRTDG